MIRAYIPRFRLVESEGGRNYYVYVIEICYAAKSHKIEKRYSAFHRLNKEIQKSYIIGEFPPKRLRNTSSKVLELRRAGLEAWLQALLRIHPVPSSVISFLQITNYQPAVLETVDGNSEDGVTHQPILSYSKDPFLVAQDRPCCLSLDHICSLNSAQLPNTVTKGVLLALYDPLFTISDL